MFHKTRISENDLVLDMVADTGEIVRAVAKSARKPGNTFSNRLDLFNVAHICVAKTKSIDIIREAVMIQNFKNLRHNLNALAGASTVSEILWRLTFDGEANPVMFDFIRKTFQTLNACSEETKVITIASSFKLLSLEGFRPQLSLCAQCGKTVDFASDYVTFSPHEGGVLCKNCDGTDANFEVTPKTVNLIDWLINSTYEEILEGSELVSKRVYEMGKLLKRWTQYHVGCNLKSLHMALH